jgi:hypothetical protein
LSVGHEIEFNLGCDAPFGIGSLISVPEVPFQRTAIRLVGASSASRCVPTAMHEVEVVHEMACRLAANTGNFGTTSFSVHTPLTMVAIIAWETALLS